MGVHHMPLAYSSRKWPIKSSQEGQNGPFRDSRSNLLRCKFWARNRQTESGGFIIGVRTRWAQGNMPQQNMFVPPQQFG